MQLQYCFQDKFVFVFVLLDNQLDLFVFIKKEMIILRQTLDPKCLRIDRVGVFFYTDC